MRRFILASPALAFVLVLALAAGAGPRSSGAPVLDLLEAGPPTRPGSQASSLSSAGDGSVFLSWFEAVDSTRHALRVSHFDRGIWSGPFTVAQGDSFFVNGADTPVVASMGGDKLMVAWPWKTGEDSYDLRVASSMDGGRHWTQPLVPHRDGTATEHGFAAMVTAQSGGMRIFWLDGRNFAETVGTGASAGGAESRRHRAMTLRTAWIGLDGQLDDEVQVDDRVCDCCPIAAVGRRSGAVIAYRDRTLDEIRDISIAWLNDRQWSEPAPVHEDAWKIEGCPVNGPALVAEGDRVAVAWFTMAGDSARVQVAFSHDRGRRFAAPIRVDHGDPIGRVSMVLLEDGSVLVGWLENRGASSTFEVRRVDPTGLAGSSMTIATTQGRPLGIPRMVRSRDRVFFAWTSNQGARQVRVAVARIPS